ncbi:MAG TPA: Kdo hydroxylase family protein [Verrucomicrobiae bacterium]|nr:Kdo hydroxylase family protein [Verrucomicrobiae bacterium]
MQMTEVADSCLVHVQEFQTQNTAGPRADGTLSQWCCEQLEDGRILHFESLPFDFPEEDRRFLISQRQGDSHLHKNISYRPKGDALRGFAPGEDGSVDRMHEVMRRYSRNTLQFLSRLLAPYASQWSLDYASFRPEAEQGRKLPLHKRNDLLHIDAFPSRPTSGGRILRCFTNINPTEPRVWETTEPFPELARKYAYSAGLAHIADNGSAGLETVLRNFGRVLGFKAPVSSPYDKFMLRFHNYLKENSAFQEHCGKVRLEFAPGSTWISFTDAVPHAVIYGQYAVEQTVIVPLQALLRPEKSPLRTLENLVGRPLTLQGQAQGQVITAHA